MDEIDNEPPEVFEENLDQPKDDLQELPIKDFSYVNSPTPPPTKSGKKRWVIILIVLVVVVAGAATAFILTKSKPTTTQPPKTAATTNSSATTAPNIPLTSYTSDSLNLTVSYPKTWAVSNPSTTSMAITSPVVNMVNAVNQTVKGKVIVSVVPKGQIPTNFGTNAATAVIASQLMKYTNPTPNQRAQTYITFAQYASTTALGAMDGIYLTGNNGYTKAQDIPPSDLSGLDPLVSVSFVGCEGTSCSSLKTMSISSNNWKNLEFQAPIMAIFKSFAFS